MLWWGSAKESGTPPFIMVCNIVRLLFIYPQTWILTCTPGHGENGSYIYLNHLLAFDSCRQVRDPSGLVISSEVHSPLLASAWVHELSSHPDKAFVEYILQGITNGFRIGFDRRQRIHSARTNLHLDKIAVVSEYLQREELL